MGKVNLDFLNDTVTHESILEKANFDMGKVVITRIESGSYYGNYALSYLKIFDSTYSKIMNKDNLDDDEIENEFLIEVKRYLVDWKDCINEYIDEIEENELDASEFKPLGFYDLLDFFIDRGYHIDNLEEEIEKHVVKIN